MFYSVLGIIALNLTVLGYASLFKKILYLKSCQKIQNIDFIYGYFLLIILSIILNFVFALKSFNIIFVIAGCLFFIYFFYKKFFDLNLISLTIISIFFVFISKNHSLNYDSQLYHLQTIQLNSNFPIVLGIANLEPRYGMNSAWHSLLSLVNLEIKSLKLIYLGNISLISFYFNEIFKKNFLIKKKLSHIFLLLSILYIAIYSFLHPSSNGTILVNLSSPEVDIVAMIFYIFSFYLFLEFIERQNDQTFNLLSVSVFLTITIKIGYIGVFLFFLYAFFVNKKKFFFNKISLILLFSGIIWILRSIFLSGCLLFPIGFSCLNSKWSMNSSDVEGYSKIIQSFARDTPERLKFGDFNHTINSYHWLYPWFEQYFLKTEFLYISILLLLLNLIIILFTFFYKKNNFPISINFYLITLFIFFINFYIWFKAPEIRFGYGAIISVVVFTVSLILITYFKKYLNKSFLYLMIFLIFIPLTFKNNKNINQISENFFQRNFDYSSVDLFYKTNEFKVYRPSQDVFCNYFQGFCSYQGFKVQFEKKGNYIIVFKY